MNAALKLPANRSLDRSVRLPSIVVHFFVAYTLTLAASCCVAADAQLDVNDVSFLWPVPRTAADAETLISLADEAADGPIMPTAVFKALVEKARTVMVGGSSIDIPGGAFDDAKTWKIAGIRVNPTALGSHPQMLAQAEVPGIRLVVQPVTVEDGEVLPHDITVHVVFNYILPPQPGQPVKPDREAFIRIVKSLRRLKTELNLQDSPLDVHPGFAPDAGPLTAQLKAFLKEHLSSAHLDKKQLGAISFMGIERGFEPWIFFKVEVDMSASNLKQVPVSGRFDPAKPTAQMISFFPNVRGKVVPAPLPPQSVQDTGTAGLFPTLPASRLDELLFPATTDSKLRHWQLRDVADIVAHPQMTTTLSTDCVSCHTESTRRHLTPGLVSQSGTAFVLPEGLSGVSPAVLPKDRWNLRNFGWGFNFDGAADAPRGFQPTVSQRAANEAAESAAFINQHYPPQP